MYVCLNGYFTEHPQTGSGQYLLHLGRELRRIAPSDTFEAVPRSKPYRALGRLGKVLWEQAGWPRAARRRGADIAHVPYFAPALKCDRQVVTVHDLAGLALPAYAGSLAMKLYNRLAVLAIRRVRLVLTDSEASAAEIQRLLGIATAGIRVIPLGVASAVAPGPEEVQRIRARYSLPESFALYLGGGDARKNLETIIKAWFLMRSAERPELVLAGRIPCNGNALFPDYRKIAHGLGLSNAVRFIGPVAEGEKAALMSAARVFVFPSRYEGFGLEPLEAMACGVPVVCSNATSLPEVVAGGALLADPDEPAEWAARVLEILADPQTARRLAQAGRERAATLTWERTARATLAAYGEIL